MRRSTACLLLLLTLGVTAGCSPQGKGIAEVPAIQAVAEVRPIEVAPGYAFDLELLPEEVEVLYSDGTSDKAGVVWNTTSLPPKVQDDLELVGKVQGTELDARIRLIVDIWAEPPVPRLSGEEVTGPNLREVMEQKVVGDQSLPVARSFGHTWSPDGQTLAFATLRHLYLWPLGTLEPSIVAAAEGTGIGGLNDPGWSHDGEYLSVQVHFSSEGQLLVFGFPQLNLLHKINIFGHAYWAPNTSQLLTACDSGLAHATMPNYSCTTDLVLFDAESGEMEVLLKADDTTLYNAGGWAGASEALYSRNLNGVYEDNLLLILNE